MYSECCWDKPSTSSRICCIVSVSGAVIYENFLTLSKASGINISEYTLRRAIRMKELPCKVIGRTYLIHWESFLRWISCEQ